MHMWCRPMALSGKTCGVAEVRVVVGEVVLPNLHHWAFLEWASHGGLHCLGLEWNDGAPTKRWVLHQPPISDLPPYIKS